MPDKEVLERVTRIETKLDMVLPHIADVPILKRDVGLMKKGFGLLFAVLPSTLALWIANKLKG